MMRRTGRGHIRALLSLRLCSTCCSPPAALLLPPRLPYSIVAPARRPKFGPLRSWRCASTAAQCSITSTFIVRHAPLFFLLVTTRPSLLLLFHISAGASSKSHPALRTKLRKLCPKCMHETKGNGKLQSKSKLPRLPRFRGRRARRH